MKYNPLRSCWRAISAATTLLVLGLVPAVQAQKSPVGTWDCVISGHRSGLAYLIFSTNFTFTGFEMLVPDQPSTPVDVRGGENIGRTGPITNNPPAEPQIFGSLVVSGPWSFDNKGRVIGFLTEISELVSCTSNAIPISTNGVGIVDPNEFCSIDTLGNLVCFTNQINCIAESNGVSFVGTVVPGKRLELSGSTGFGGTSYRGIPAATLPDRSGPWYGAVKNVAGVPGEPLEFFTLSVPTDFASQFPNTYDVVGVDPQYGFSGHAMFSSQNRMAFVVGVDPDDTVVRSVTGAFNSRKGTANLQGWQQSSGIFTNHIRFNVTQQK